MATVERPHRRALDEAIGIYRDAMRPFILRCLRRVRGSTVEETIRRSLPPKQADTFNLNRRQGRDLASAIDVNIFRPLVQRNWSTFRDDFWDDRTVLDAMGLIATARDSTAHPEDKRDLDAEYTRVTLYHLVFVLGRINAPDQKRAVENIRTQLFAPTSVTADTGLTALPEQVQRGGVRFIAVDWSGAKDRADQTKRIWLAEAANCELLRLESGRTRDEVVDILVKEMQSRDVVIGLDFAFSFPQWYLQWRKLSGARKLWELAASEGEMWLSETLAPFWVSKKSDRLKSDERLEYRETEWELRRRGFPPQSVFKLVGPGQVGRGSVRGQPYLLELQRAGAAIWPFDAPKMPMVIEIYPRSLTGKVEKTDREARADYLTRKYPGLDLGRGPARKMVESDDAFDAGVSALVMSAHAEDFGRLERATEPPKSLEGEIWSP